MRLPLVALTAAVLLSAGDRKFPPGVFETDRIEIKSTVYPDPADVKRLVGSDFGGAVVIVELTITPLGGEPLEVRWENFQLFSNKDAQRSPPFHPAQLAGRGALVLGKTYGSSGTYAGNPNGPIGGGLPGTMGRPQQYPGSGGGIGNGSAVTEGVESKGMQDSKEDPVLHTLKAKVLPEGKFTQPISGLLYFGVDGKQKVKDLELFYRGPAGKFAVAFKK